MVMGVDPRTIASLLAEVELFGELDEATRLNVATRASRRVVERGQVIFWQDEPGEGRGRWHRPQEGASRLPQMVTDLSGRCRQPSRL
jgi:hypothetical protein